MKKVDRNLDKRQNMVVGGVYNMLNILQNTDSSSVADFDDFTLRQIDLLRQLIVDTKVN